MKSLTNTIIIILLIGAVFSQAGPLLWRDPKTIDKGSFIAMTGIGYNKTTKSWNWTNEEWVDQQASQQITTIASHLMFGYGLLNNTEILLHIPTAMRFRDTLSSKGIGDIWLKAKYCFLKGKNKPSAAGLFAVRLPTSSKDAKPLIDDHTLDFAIGAKIATQKFGNFVGHLKLAYWFNGVKDDTINLGDEIEGIVKIDYWLAKSAFFFLNCEIVEGFKNKDDQGNEISNTEKRNLQVTPGLTIKPIPGLTLRPKVVFPLLAVSKGGNTFSYALGIDVWYIK